MRKMLFAVATFMLLFQACGKKEEKTVSGIFLSVGLFQRDGLFILLVHFTNLVTMVYFAVLLLGGGVALKELWQKFFG